jgi:hypothetical protein
MILDTPHIAVQKKIEHHIGPKIFKVKNVRTKRVFYP